MDDDAVDGFAVSPVDLGGMLRVDPSDAVQRGRRQSGLVAMAWRDEQAIDGWLHRVTPPTPRYTTDWPPYSRRWNPPHR
jgi:hypothetical protein